MTVTAELDIPALLRIPPEQHDEEWLKKALGWAFNLEFATIPLYLFALWSVKDRQCEVADAIRGIVWQEMFHMAMAGNLMTRLGATPELQEPSYPATGLPGNVHKDLTVRLKGVNSEIGKDDDVLKTFMTIEKPEKPLARCESFNTIGALYAAIKKAYTKHFPTQLTGKQVTGRIGGDELFAIDSKDKMIEAIDLVTEQGEGTSQVPDPKGEMAHYYRFGEIWHGKRIIETTPGKWEFSGESVPRPPVYPMPEVPAGGWGQEAAWVRPELNAVNGQYHAVLTTVVKLWSTDCPTTMADSVQGMIRLERLAVGLIEKQGKKSVVYGPEFAARVR